MLNLSSYPLLHLLLGLGSFASTSTSTSPCIPPNVNIFLLDTSVKPAQGIGDGATQLDFSFNDSSNPTFLLHCKHTVPIRWVLEVDTLLGQLTQVGGTATSRSVVDFYNPSTYTYTANVSLSLEVFSDVDAHVKDYIFICQPFTQQNSSGCVNANISANAKANANVTGTANIATVLAQLQSKLLSVGVLSPDKILQGVPSLALFDAKLKQSQQPHPHYQNNSDDTTCPFTLHLALGEYFELYVEWISNTSGIESTFTVTNVQALENLNRFHPQVDEHCVHLVDVSSIKSQDRSLDWDVHEFYPRIFTYATENERMTVKTYFNLKKRQLQFSWESVDPQDMIDGRVIGPHAYNYEPEVYKGQTFTVRCSMSVYIFSTGTIIAWTFPNLDTTHGMHTGFVPSSNIITNERLEVGGIRLEATVFFPRDFLVQNDLNDVQMACIAPRWNDSSWVNSTFSVVLRDSELPEIIYNYDIDDPDSNKTASTTVYEIDEHEKELNISCEASGIPLPSVEFIPPRNNLALEIDSQLVQNGSRVVGTLRFANITSEIEGEYICVAKSVVGEARRMFKVKLRQGLPQFLLIILIVGGVAVLIFVLLSSVLLIKLRKEKAQFMKATEEAIKKFREGFATGDLGFKANSEYKDYEIPLYRWGLGNTLLGSGAFGVVQKGIIYHGENRQDVVAVKTINSPKDVTDFENSLMELTIMSYIGKHPHVVSLVGACTDNIGKRNILIGVEYCANGDLLNYLQKHRSIFSSILGADGLLSLDSICERSSYANVTNSGNLTTLDLYKWSFQIADGMDFLASKKILHADLAARNVLLTEDNICKISDFGLSRQLLMSDNYTKKTNTPLPWPWMAIESLKYRQFSSASDIWSYGVTLFEIFTLGEQPWSGLEWTVEFQDKLEKGRRLPRAKFCTNNMYNKIMLECWSTEANERITFSQAKEFFEKAINILTFPEGNDNQVLNNIC